MADDIDIEEHDVLDNSIVKKMFPDLAIVKTELILDEEEEAQESIEEENCADHNEETPITDPSDSSYQIQDKTEPSQDNFETLPYFEGIPDSTTDLEEAPKRITDSPQVVTSTQDTDSPKHDFHNNCIILGSKPNTQTDCAGTLDDLELKRCYSATILLKDWGGYLQNSDSYCRDCEILFATVNAFDAHKMLAHSFLVAVERSSPELPQTSVKTEPEAPVKRDCFVCKKVFFNEAELIKHIYLHIDSAHKCSMCDKTFSSKQLLEDHVKTGHKSEGEALSFQCNICLCYFDMAKSFTHHMASSHGTAPSKYERIRENLCCISCNVSFSTRSTFNNHIKDFHSNLFRSNRTVAQPKLLVKKKNISYGPKLKQVESPRNDFNCLIPIGTLFKCPKCEVHFTDYSVANYHFSICPNKANNYYKCKKCKLNVKMTSSAAHAQQHSTKPGHSFDVYEVGDQNLRNRLLYQCPKCDVYHNESEFLSHLNSCKGQTESVHCKLCDVRLAASMKKPHTNLHNTTKDSEYFIQIQFAGVTSHENVTENSSNAQLALAVPKKEHVYKFYLCKHCDCFIMLINNNSVKVHNGGRCKNIPKSICNRCGLVLTRNTKPRHMKAHEELPEFDLDNFLFYCLDTKELLKPIPKYPRCGNCQIHFHSTMSLSNHVCSMMAYKKCQKCDLKFNHTSIKLHTLYHDYQNTPAEKAKVARKAKRLLAPKKGSVLFYCFKCKCCMHNAAHLPGAKFCNYNRGNVCSECGLRFTSKALYTHRKWHQRSKIGVQDMEFHRLPDGKAIMPPIPVYDSCKKCKVYFLSKLLLRNHICFNTLTKRCNVCKINLSLETFALHLNFHAATAETAAESDEISCSVSNLLLYYCTVCRSYMSQVGRHLSMAECSKNDPKRTCQYCGLIFSPKAIMSHKRYHKTHGGTLKNFSFLRLQDRKAMTRPPLPEYYSCKKCRVHFHMKVILKYHKCGFEPFKTCYVCDIQLCAKDTYKLHMAFHDYGKVEGAKGKIGEVFKCRSCHGIFPQSALADHKNGTNPCATNTSSLKSCRECKHSIYKPYFEDHLKIHSNMHIREFDRPTSNSYKFYKCKNCETCFDDEPTVRKHICNTISKESCTICGLVIPVDAVEEHLLKHDEDPNFCTKNFSFVTFSPSVEKMYSIYKCKKCGVCLIKKHSILEHLSKGMCDLSFWTCPKCNLKVKNLNSHLKFHIMNPNFDNRNINIITVGNPNDVNNKKRVKTLIDVYQCKTCDYVAFEKKYMMKHRTACKKIRSNNAVVCSQCNLPIRPLQSPMHERIHKINPQLSRQHIHVIHFEPGAISNLQKPIKDENRESEHNKVNTMKTLHFYQCQVCDYVAFTNQSKYKHTAKRRCKESKTAVTCKQCALPVRPKQKLLHARMHRWYPHMKAKNISLTKFGGDKKPGDSEMAVSKSPGAKYVLYRCRACEVITLRTNYHVSCNVPTGLIETVMCPHCLIPITLSQRYSHQALHKKFPDMSAKNTRVVEFGERVAKVEETVDDIVETADDEGIVIQKCSECDVCFVSKEDIDQHLKDNHDVDEVANCADCGLSFFKYVLPQHIVKHHANGCQLEDFVIKEIALPKRVRVYKSAAMKRKHDGELVTQPCELFQCNCGLNFLCSISLDDHEPDCKGSTESGLRCSKCDLVFDSKQLLRHSLKHHSSKSDFEFKIVRKDSTVTVGNKAIIAENKASDDENKAGDAENKANDVHVEETTRGRGRRTIKSINRPLPCPNRKITSDYSNNLFYCKLCDVHFLKQNTLSKHLRPKHVPFKSEAISCSLCGLRFSKHSLTQHLEGQHNNCGYTLDDFCIRDVDEKVIKSCASETKDPKKTKVATVKNKCLTYYKCYECNVVFLKEKKYNKHIQEHTQMTEYDYLECKICKMNFVVDSLKMHMDHHKSNVFSLDTCEFIGNPAKESQDNETEIVDVCSMNTDIADDNVIDEVNQESTSNSDVKTISDENTEADSSMVESSSKSDDAEKDSTSKDTQQKIILVYK